VSGWTQGFVVSAASTAQPALSCSGNSAWPWLKCNNLPAHLHPHHVQPTPASPLHRTLKSPGKVSSASRTNGPTQLSGELGTGNWELDCDPKTINFPESRSGEMLLSSFKPGIHRTTTDDRRAISSTEVPSRLRHVALLLGSAASPNNRWDNKVYDG
jgi:hypothetical protein